MSFNVSSKPNSSANSPSALDLIESKPQGDYELRVTKPWFFGKPELTLVPTSGFSSWYGSLKAYLFPKQVAAARKAALEKVRTEIQEKYHQGLDDQEILQLAQDPDDGSCRSLEDFVATKGVSLKFVQEMIKNVSQKPAPKMVCALKMVYDPAGFLRPQDSDDESSTKSSMLTSISSLTESSGEEFGFDGADSDDETEVSSRGSKLKSKQEETAPKMVCEPVGNLRTEDSDDKLENTSMPRGENRNEQWNYLRPKLEGLIDEDAYIDAETFPLIKNYSEQLSALCSSTNDQSLQSKIDDLLQRAEKFLKNHQPELGADQDPSSIEKEYQQGVISEEGDDKSDSSINMTTSEDQSSDDDRVSLHGRSPAHVEEGEHSQKQTSSVAAVSRSSPEVLKSSQAAKSLLQEILPIITKVDEYTWLTNSNISESVREQKMIAYLSSLTDPSEIMTKGVQEGGAVSVPGVAWGTTTVTPFEITLYAFVPRSSEKVKEMLQDADKNASQLTPDCKSCTIQTDLQDKNVDTATYRFKDKKIPDLVIKRKFTSLTDGSAWELKWSGSNALFNTHEGDVTIADYQGTSTHGELVEGSLIRYHAKVVPSAVLAALFSVSGGKEDVQVTILQAAATTVAALQRA